MPKTTVTVGARTLGTIRLKLGLALIRCGCWLCRSYRIEVTVGGVKTKTIRPTARLTITMTGDASSLS